MPTYVSEQPEIKEEAKPSYKYVIEKPTGWFKTGQEADIILYATGFNESGGPLVLNHPGKVATDGKRLMIADTWNNRVLIWNEIPTKNNQAPDLVLGQPDFTSQYRTNSRNRLFMPYAISLMAVFSGWGNLNSRIDCLDLVLENECWRMKMLIFI